MSIARDEPVAGVPPRRRGRPPGSVTGSAEDTRERVLDVAMDLFAANGFHGTSVSDIGTQSGLQPGALYYHIGSKEELLWRILSRYTEDALEVAEGIAASDRDPVDKLRELIKFHVRTIAEHRREVMIQLRDASALTGDHATRLQALRRRFQKCWERVLAEGYKAGTLRQADRFAVNGLLGMVNMMALWYRPGRDSPKRIAEQFCTMVLDGLIR
jgi:TetR/AcrR family transcriptional regulator, cholesterol catabolism regulator